MSLGVHNVVVVVVVVVVAAGSSSRLTSQTMRATKPPTKNIKTVIAQTTFRHLGA
jgi:hypothetical protein